MWCKNELSVCCWDDSDDNLKQGWWNVQLGVVACEEWEDSAIKLVNR